VGANPKFVVFGFSKADLKQCAHSTLSSFTDFS